MIVNKLIKSLLVNIKTPAIKPIINIFLNEFLSFNIKIK